MVELTTFGGLGLMVGGSPVAGATAQRRRLVLLAVLAAQYPAALARETLGTLLWGEAEPEVARNNLRQAIFGLRQGARTAGATADPVVGAAELALNPVAVAADCLAFCVAITAGDHAAAIRLYHGEFLAGVELPESPAFGVWVGPRRALYAAQFRSACVAVATDAANRGAWETALETWHALRVHAPDDADAIQGVLTALVATGRAAEAAEFAAAHNVVLPLGRIESHAERTAPDAAATVASALGTGSRGRTVGRPAKVVLFAGGAALIALTLFAATRVMHHRAAVSAYQPSGVVPGAPPEIAIRPLTGPGGDTTMSAVGALARDAAVAQLQSFGGVRVEAAENATPTPMVFRGSYHLTGNLVRLDAAVEDRTGSRTKVVTLRSVICGARALRLRSVTPRRRSRSSPTRSARATPNGTRRSRSNRSTRCPSSSRCAKCPPIDRCSARSSCSSPRDRSGRLLPSGSAEPQVGVWVCWSELPREAG